MTQIRRLTYEMIRVAEKGARIARMIRAEKILFDLLVQEKVGTSKNDRFDADFKTLADVLIQEVAKHDLEHKFPDLRGHIFGEENAVFENRLGQSVVMTVDDDEAKTQRQLAQVLDGNDTAATLLAQIAHSDVTVATDEKLDHVVAEIDTRDIAIWIDPIDSTAQYIGGGDAAGAGCTPPYAEGLQCVTVLIGAFRRSTGLPVVGVICQPFSSLDGATGSWSGRCIWGVSHDGVAAHNCRPPPPGGATERRTLVVSGADADAARLEGAYRLRRSAGAGYKALCVVDGVADAYVLTHASTYKWDTCAPHAVLRAAGGGATGCDAAARSRGKSDEEIGLLLEECQLRYDKPDSDDLPESKKWSNASGVIAYRDPSFAKTLLRDLT